MVNLSSEWYVCELTATTPPALEVEPWRAVRLSCRSACDRHVGTGPDAAPAPNPATGPIAVRGAGPGHALVVEIVAIEPAAVGYLSAPGGGYDEFRITEGIFSYRGVRLEVEPMIGVLGVAPGEGAWRTMECGPFGGNLDIRDFRPGATVWLPVFQPGGLLVAGDVHALMADGEIGGQGLEVAAEVVLRLSVEEQPLGVFPYLVCDDRLMTIGTGASLDEAAVAAAEGMIAVLSGCRLLSTDEARKFLGLVGQLRVGQFCCETKSARVAVPLDLVPALRLRLRSE